MPGINASMAATGTVLPYQEILKPMTSLMTSKDGLGMLGSEPRAAQQGVSIATSGNPGSGRFLELAYCRMQWIKVRWEQYHLVKDSGMYTKTEEVGTSKLDLNESK